jgi:hypothetical protein
MSLVVALGAGGGTPSAVDENRTEPRAGLAGVPDAGPRATDALEDLIYHLITTKALSIPSRPVVDLGWGGKYM